MVYQGKLEYVILDTGDTTAVIDVCQMKPEDMISTLNPDITVAEFLKSDIRFRKKVIDSGTDELGTIYLPDISMVVADTPQTYQLWKDKGFLVVPLGVGISKNSQYILEDIENHTAESLECIFLRLKGLPWYIAYTDRVLIREITLEDVPKLYELYSDRRVSRFVEPLYEDIKEELEYTQKYINNCYGFYEFGTWILEDKSTGKIIGRAGLEPVEDRVELGYVIAGDYQGRGIATECCNSIIKIAQEILPEETIWARCHVDNLASQRILEKLGFLVDTGKSDKDGGNTKWYMKNL